MRKLPALSTREIVAALLKLGLEELPGRGKGSHVVLWRPALQRPIVIPDRKALDPGALRKTLRAAEISEEAFLDAL